MKSLRWLSWVVSIVLVVVPFFARATDAQNVTKNSIETILVSKSVGGTVLRIGMRNALPTQPSSFSITNPARLVFDFPDTTNGLGFSSKSINEGGVRSLNVVQAGDRSRLILNLDKSARFESRLEEKFLLITLGDEQGQAGSGAVSSQHFSAGATQDSHGIRDIQFRRSKDGAGVVVIEMSTSDGGIDLQQKGGSLFATFKKTRLPGNLRRQMDVIDFATPVVSVKTRPMGEDVSMEIVPQGLWEHIAFQSDNQFIIEVKPVKEDGGKMFQGTKTGFQGEAISLNFQNIPVRELLHVFADITNFNIVVSDSVSGNVSLRLNDIPWDQALDIVLEQRNLSMRKNGNVMWIAPRDELAAKDKLQAEARDAALIAEVPRMEVFQLNYQRAEDFSALLSASKASGTSGASGGSGGFLSSLGSVSVDKRTNQIFIHDVPTKLVMVRDLLTKVDRPARQVLIEARIVEASDRFTKNLGVRLGIVDRVGYRTGASPGNPRVMLGGSTQIPGFQTGQLADTPNYISTGTDDTFGVDLPASSIDSRNVGQFSLTLFNRSLTQFLNLELSALEVDGRGKIISSPRIVTADQVEALIEQGTEVPFLTASASGATTVGYKKAVLALKVKPQITPEGKVIMAISVNKDSPNPQYSTTYGIALDTKHIKTDVLVENGGTVVIGGIYTQDERDTNTRIPVLGDLPYVGFMFRNRERQSLNSELLVFITPKIIPDVNLN